jgi:hypothetical protein
VKRERSTAPPDKYAPSNPERTQTFYVKWIAGGVVPMCIAVYAVPCIIMRTAIMLGRHTQLTIHGANAIAAGLAYLGVALFLYCRFYWGSVYEEIWFAQLGQIIGGIFFISGMAVLIVRVGVYGIA